MMNTTNHKEPSAHAQAAMAMRAAHVARKRVYDDMTTRGIAKHVPAPDRTSTKGFAAKDPWLALAALECVDIEIEATTHTFEELGVAVFKYSVRTLSARLTQPLSDTQASLFLSMRSSALMAAKTVRHVYEVALELATIDPEQYLEASQSLEWHGPQSMLKGRETRGAGVVM